MFKSDQALIKEDAAKEVKIELSPERHAKSCILARVIEPKRGIRVTGFGQTQIRQRVGHKEV